MSEVRTRPPDRGRGSDEVGHAGLDPRRSEAAGVSVNGRSPPVRIVNLRVIRRCALSVGFIGTVLVAAPLPNPPPQGDPQGGRERKARLPPPQGLASSERRRSDGPSSSAHTLG